MLLHGKPDQCSRVTIDKTVTFTCYRKALAELVGYKNNQCNSATQKGMKIETCLCDTAGCNSQWISGFDYIDEGNSAHRPTNQVIVILVIASLMKLIFD